MKRASVVFVLAFLAGCAAEKAPASPTATPAAAAPAGYPAQQEYPAMTSPMPQPQATSAPPPPAPPSETPRKSAETSDSAASGAPGTSGSFAQSGDFERAQRELDRAGSDCKNACRALGSMDRAAGKLCTMARSSDERGRCDDAKTKVQNARDRVKRTCTSCPDVTVDRDAAIPSR